jgi:hypothetical protein
MRVEIFTPCDYASSSSGKMTLAGIFDGLEVPAFPHELLNISFGLKMRLEPEDDPQGLYNLELLFDAPNGSVLARLQGAVHAITSPQRRESIKQGALLISFNIQGVSLPSAGQYGARVFVNNRPLGETIFYVYQRLSKTS